MAINIARPIWTALALAATPAAAAAPTAPAASTAPAAPAAPATSTAAPSDTGACLIPVAPATLRADLLAPYRALVEAYDRCVTQELAELGDGGRERDPAAAARRTALVLERAAAIAAFRGYAQRVAR